jgi:hypothetical protein
MGRERSSIVNQIVDVLTAIVIVGGILVLTRPQSQGPALVTALGSGFSNALGVAVGTPGVT